MSMQVRGRSPAARELRRKREVTPQMRSRSSPAYFTTSAYCRSPALSPCLTPSEDTMGLSASSVDCGSERSFETRDACPLRWADDEPEDSEILSMPTPRGQELPYPENCLKAEGYEFPTPDWTPPEINWYQVQPNPCTCSTCSPMGNWDLFFRLPPAHLTAHMYPVPSPMVVMKKKRRRGRRGRGKSKKNKVCHDVSDSESDTE